MALPPISPTGVATAFSYPTQTAQGLGLSAVFGATPGSINPPIIWEPGPDLTGNRRQIFIIATGRSPNWGGCQVHVSVDNTTYFQGGNIASGGTQGLLTAPFPSGADPDTVHTLAVDVSESRSQVIAGTTLDADDYLSLAYVDGEIVAYSAATLTGAGKYNIGTYLRRGVYDPAAIASHAAGTKFGLIDGATYREEYSRRLVGKTIYFKFPSFNTLGGQLEDIATVPFYVYLLTGVGGTVPWVQSFSVGGEFTDLVLDEWDGNYEIFDVEMPFDVTFATGFRGSPIPGCEVAPAANVTLTIQKISNDGNTVGAIGTLRIAAGQKLGSYTLLGPVTILTGDRMRLYADSGVDATIAGFFGTIVGTRQQ